jgi:hypothetical protein
MKESKTNTALADKELLKLIENVICSKGMYQMSDKEKALLKQLIPTTAPNVPRAKYADEQVTYWMDLKGYTLFFYSTFIPSLQSFAKHGSPYLILAKTDDPSGKRYFVVNFHKAGDLVKNVTLTIRFLIDKFRNCRPVSHGKRADILRNKETGEYFWVVYDETGENILFKEDFFEATPANNELLKHGYKIRDIKKRDAEKRKKAGKKPVGSTRKTYTNLPPDKRPKQKGPKQLVLDGLK